MRLVLCILSYCDLRCRLSILVVLSVDVAVAEAVDVVVPGLGSA